MPRSPTRPEDPPGGTPPPATSLAAEPTDGERLAAALAALQAERAARVRAERVNQARDDFLGLVSHELRTPLNAMVGWLHVLESGRDFGEQALARATAGLGRAVTQQRELVDTLLETARALRGDLKLDRAPTEMSSLAAQALDRSKARHAGLSVELRTAAPVPLDADAPRLSRLLDELLAHAAKFPDQGPLSLRVEPPADGSATAVLRMGFDAPSEAAWAAFRTASDADLPQARRRALTLGLILGRLVCELHGGGLDVDEAEDGPRGLRLSLPVADARASGPAPARH